MYFCSPSACRLRPASPYQFVCVALCFHQNVAFVEGACPSMRAARPHAHRQTDKQTTDNRHTDNRHKSRHRSRHSSRHRSRHRSRHSSRMHAQEQAQEQTQQQAQEQTRQQDACTGTHSQQESQATCKHTCTLIFVSVALSALSDLRTAVPSSLCLLFPAASCSPHSS